MILFIGLSIIHILIVLWLLFHWSRIDQSDDILTSGKTFTILIPIRNEEKNIKSLLSDLSLQSYDKSKFEVIVIDDHSEDESSSIVKEFGNQCDFDLRLINLETVSGKKAAITSGVGAAKNEIIITTDGDCKVDRDWIAAYALHYEEHDLQMLAAPVRMNGKSIIAQLQTIEFASLIGFGAAAIQSGNPSTCNGANMSYKKKAFEEVNGYQGNEQIPSGDDEFLLQKLHAKYPSSVGFLKNIKSIVHTPAKETFIDLVNQRIRWSSKWKFHKNWFARFAAIYIFTDYLMYLIMIVLALLGNVSAVLFVALIGARYLADILYLQSVARFLKMKIVNVMTIGMALQIFYPLFVSLLGIASIFTGYSWKGRKY